MRTMRWALPCLLLLPITTAMAANITVRPDRNPATLEESFHLIFEATGDLDGNPDFAPLKKDFRILSQSSISNVSIVNSRIHNIKTWKLSVFALRDGNIPIPPVAFGKDRSPAASVVVKRSRAGQAGQQQDDVFVELKVNPQQVYVQQQLMAKVKLYRAVGTPNATLTGPELESGRAITEHLEQDSKYETVIGNRRYHVLERNFAIYPQESGRLKFKPAVFQGQVDRNVGGRKQREHIIRRSAAVELNVKPIPAAFPGAHWLPAARVELSEQWSKDPSTMQVGEPVTRTLNITVTGLTASQLPVLEGALDGSFKQYPDQPQLETRKNATGSTAIRRDKVALIPVIAGDFTLPEIKLPWWNTQTSKLEYATLPERKISILAADTTDPDILTVPGMPDTGEPTTEPEPPTGVAQAGTLWRWLSIVLTVIWLLTLCLWFYSRQQTKKIIATRAANESLRKLTAAIKQACRANDPPLARTCLINWGKLYWPDANIMNLDDIQQQCQPPLATAITELSLSLYGREQSAWQGDELWSALQLQQEHREETRGGNQGRLQPLHRL